MLYKTILMLVAVLVCFHAMRQTVYWALAAYTQRKLGRGAFQWWMTTYGKETPIKAAYTIARIARKKNAMLWLREHVTTHMLVRGASGEEVLELHRRIACVDSGEYVFVDSPYR